MAGLNVKVSTKPVATPTTQDYLFGVLSGGNTALYPASTINGGSYTLGVTPPELAPSLDSASWSKTGTTPPTQPGGGIMRFTAASNLAACSYTGAVLKDNQTYNCSITIAGLTGGKAQVMIYGPTTAHLGASAEFTANGTYNFQVTTNAAGTVLNTIRIRATGTSGTNTFDVTAFSVKEVPVAYPVRSMTERVKEAICSLRDFDSVDPTGNNDSSSGIARAIAECGRRLLVPAGSYAVDRVLVNRAIEILGEGREFSIFNVFGVGGIHGMQLTGEDALGRSNLIQLRNFQLRYIGAGQTVAGSGPGQNNWSGLYVQRKVIADGIYVRGFTNDGIYFAPFDEAETGVAGTIDEAPFFCEFHNVWSKFHGRDGLVVRRGTNGNIFDLNQVCNNGRYGLHQFTDGFGTYNNNYRAGQAAYNKQIGWYFENGHENNTSGLYAEKNGRTDVNTESQYTNTLYDYWFGNNCTDSWFGIGSIFGNDLATKGTHVNLPTFNPDRIQIWHGGRKLYGN